MFSAMRKANTDYHMVVLESVYTLSPANNLSVQSVLNALSSIDIPYFLFGIKWNINMLMIILFSLHVLPVLVVVTLQVICPLLLKNSSNA